MRAGPDVWRLGRVWSSSELYSRGALVNGGRSLGHLLLLSRRDRERERLVRSKGGSNAFLHISYVLSGYLTVTCTHSHAQDLLLPHLFKNHFRIQTTSCKLRALSAEPHIPTFSFPQPICVMLTDHIFPRALTKTRRMSRHSHYSHKDGCCSSNIARAAAQ